MGSGEIPAFLAHLPVYRGYPVPYFVPKDKDGVFQFKYASQEKMETCVKYHKCCVCFKPLTKGNYFFISGPVGLETQTDAHPPMHQQCAEYSLKGCPHIFLERTNRTTKHENTLDWQIRDKPQWLFLVQAKAFKAIYPDGRHFAVKYSSVLSRRIYTYENGILTEQK